VVRSDLDRRRLRGIDFGPIHGQSDHPNRHKKRVGWSRSMRWWPWDGSRSRGNPLEMVFRIGSAIASAPQNAQCVYGVSNPAGQAARLEFRNKRAVGALRQIVVVNELDLAVAGRHPRQKLSEFFGKGRVEVGQFCGQLVALNPSLEPLPQFRYRRLQPVALERGIVHGAASVGNIICGRGEVEGAFARAFGRIGG
jgi:hypothetical protein